MDDLTAALVNCRLLEHSRIHVEIFGAGPAITPEPPSRPSRSTYRGPDLWGPDVTFAHSGLRETTVLSGAVAHELDLVEPPADGNVLICYSTRRGLGPVVHVRAQLDRPSSVRNWLRADSVG
jgi:hypothetical protein